jgi:hypothetical protein
VVFEIDKIDVPLTFNTSYGSNIMVSLDCVINVINKEIETAPEFCANEALVILVSLCEKLNAISKQ